MSVFVYGTLMFPEVLQALIERVPRSQAAVIHGYQRGRIRGQVFPGTVRASAAERVRGLVLFDLRPEELEVGAGRGRCGRGVGGEAGAPLAAAQASCQPRFPAAHPPATTRHQMLDEFEGEEYYKEGVRAQLEGGGAPAATYVYLWRDHLRAYLHGPDWEPQEFRCLGGGGGWMSARRGRCRVVQGGWAQRSTGWPCMLHAHPPGLPACPPPLCRERELARYVDMCRSFAADVQEQRGWKGQFPPASSSPAESESESEAAPGDGSAGGAAEAAAGPAAGSGQG